MGCRDCLSRSVQYGRDTGDGEVFGSEGLSGVLARICREKNSAIDKVKGPWILSVDADERITPALRQEIEEVLGSVDTKEGYYVARKNFFCGRWIRHGGWYPDYNLRLFRKDQ